MKEKKLYIFIEYIDILHKIQEKIYQYISING